MLPGVRQQFEQQRKKLLTHDEKIIFKDIALDYAKNRLNNLEQKLEKTAENDSGKRRNSTNKQWKPAKKEKENRHTNYGSGTITNKDVSKEIKTNSTSTFTSIKKANPGNTPYLASQQRPQGKFTFKKIEATGSSNALLKKTTINDTKHQRKINDEDFVAKSSGLSRNELALSESKVTTPKRQRAREKKSVTPKSEESKQSTVDVWITPKAKRRREDPPFSYSPQNALEFARDVNNVSDGLHWNDSDVDDDVDVSGADNISQQRGGFMDDVSPWTNADPRSRNLAATGTGKSIGSAPSDKFGITQARKRSRGSSSDYLQSAASTSNHSTNMMECPLCSGREFIIIPFLFLTNERNWL